MVLRNLRKNKKITQEMVHIRKERTKRLESPISKKIDKDIAEKLFNEQGGEGLLDRLKYLSDFEIEDNGQKWLIENCKSPNELIYVFQLFLQRALNKGRSFSNLEDFKCITENVDFNILKTSNDPLIGSVYTLGMVDGKIEKINIRCCAVPVKKGKGTITCIEKLPIDYFPLIKIIKDFNIYIKIHPKKPENLGQWEAALITAIYSSVFNKAFSNNTLILGGITKKGRITPINTEIIQKLEEKQYTIFISDEKKHNINIDNSSHFIYVKHIDEINLSLQKIVEVAYKRIYKDFLCD
jgi:hypothetical protein